jgi:HK97 gp10 family phage protein
MDLRIEVDDAALKETEAQLMARLTRAVYATAAAIEASAKQRAPVDTGFLRSSIQARPVGPAEAEVSVGAEYGAHVEYGTRRQAAQPYLTPAVEGERQRFEARVKKAVEGQG